MSNFTTSGNSFYEEILRPGPLHQRPLRPVCRALGQAEAAMDYNFLGLDLSATPNWKFWTFNLSAGAWAVIGLFLIPIISTGLSYLSIYISQKMNPTTATMNAQQQSSTSASPYTQNTSRMCSASWRKRSSLSRRAVSVSDDLLLQAAIDVQQRSGCVQGHASPGYRGPAAADPRPAFARGCRGRCR